MRSPEHCVKLERWQGLPNMNKVILYEIVLSFKDSLFIVYLVTITVLTVEILIILFV